MVRRVKVLFELRECLLCPCQISRIERVLQSFHVLPLRPLWRARMNRKIRSYRYNRHILLFLGQTQLRFSATLPAPNHSIVDKPRKLDRQRGVSLRAARSVLPRVLPLSRPTMKRMAAVGAPRPSEMSPPPAPSPCSQNMASEKLLPSEPSTCSCANLSKFVLGSYARHSSYHRCLSLPVHGRVVGAHQSAPQSAVPFAAS